MQQVLAIVNDLDLLDAVYAEASGQYGQINNNQSCSYLGEKQCFGKITNLL